MTSAIELRIEPRVRSIGMSDVRRLIPHHSRRMVGPFIFADVMGPDEIAAGGSGGVDAHPHIGMSTLTYLFEGRMIHRDSTGAMQAIEPGAVNWMTAGSGVAHTERPHPDDIPRTRSLHGLQTWVALPDEAEEATPSFEHAGEADVPSDTFRRSLVRVAAGSGWGMDSPVSGSSPLVLAEIRLDGDSPVPVDTTLPELAVIPMSGEVRVNGDPLVGGEMAVLRSGAAATLAGDGVAMVLGGEPVGKRHIWWNFVHSDPDRIEQAKADWLAQTFPKVPGDHEPFVPLPPSPSSKPGRTGGGQ